MFRLALTPSMMNVVKAHRGGSEYLDDAENKGMEVWVSSLLFPGEASWLAFRRFVKFRHDIAVDNLADHRAKDRVLDERELREYNATRKLFNRMCDARPKW